MLFCITLWLDSISFKTNRILDIKPHIRGVFCLCDDRYIRSGRSRVAGGVSVVSSVV